MARIEVTKYGFRLGYVYRIYRWVGSPSETAYLSYRDLRNLEKMPWPLQVIEYGMAGAQVARTDGINHWTSHWHVFREKWRQVFGLAVYRCWLTLEIWNLATLTDGEIPTWRNLRWFRKRGK